VVSEVTFVLWRLVPLVLLALVWAPAACAWSWPVQGPVLQGFSFDPGDPYAAGQHRGVDIGAATGTSVLAPAAGTISFASTVPASGLCVTIETADGYSVTLTHLGTILVSRGAAVGEGDVVGTVGPSGTPDFDVPYVHLGIRVAADANGYVDPLTLLPASPPSAPDAPGAPAATATPPAETTSATPTATAPAAPAPAPAVSVPASAPVPAPAPAHVVPISTPAAAGPVIRAATEKPAEGQSRPAPVLEPVRPRSRAAIEDDAGRAHAGWQPQPAAETPVALRHRPVPAPAPAHEGPALAGTEFPAAPLALGAGASAAAAAAALLAVLLLRRRRPAPASAPGGVVIPLRWPEMRREERRAA
jgi:Peptidase family M23